MQPASRLTKGITHEDSKFVCSSTAVRGSSYGWSKAGDIVGAESDVCRRFDETRRRRVRSAHEDPACDHVHARQEWNDVALLSKMDSRRTHALRPDRQSDGSSRLRR